MQRDKRFLKLFAEAVHTELRRQNLSKPFRITSKIKVCNTYSDGWSVTVGTFTGFQTSAEVWIDRFTRHSERKVYYTLFATKPVGLAALTKEAKTELGKHLSIYRSNWDQECKYSRLGKPLAKARFGHPVYERYPDIKQYFYGVYELDRKGLQRNEFQRLAERAVEFFRTIANAVAPNPSQQDWDIYPAVENRQSVSRHLRRERNSHIATMRKQQDNYVCTVCRFDFLKTYGIIGNDFAEAHHLIPLSMNQKIRQTNIDDLATVCANCHRMLHRMRGTRSDVAKLQRIIRSRKHR